MKKVEIADIIAQRYNIGLEVDNSEKEEYLIYWPDYVAADHNRVKCDSANPPKSVIYMNKDGKYIYLYKKEEPNRYFRYNLATKSFERVNIYKTTDNKISPVKPENLRYWFYLNQIVTTDPVFARVFLWNKASGYFIKYKNPVRYIEAFHTNSSQYIEEWYNAGIVLEDVEKIFQDTIKNGYADSGRFYNYHKITVRPSDFDKQLLQIIKKIKTVSVKTLEAFRSFDASTLFKYEQLYQLSKKPEYDECFNIELYNSETNIFDFTNYHAEIARTRILAVINEFNLNPESLCKFLARLRRVEGCNLEDLTDGYHYRDYLRMEKTLNNENLSKIDKYPKNWLTTFRRTKRNYNDIKKEIDEKKFKQQIESHSELLYSDKNYSIILPNHSDDIREEGSRLKHCVASYVDRVTEGATLIAFCREKKDLDEPYVTVEVKNNCLTQAYAYQDSKPNDDVLKFLAKWAKKKDIELAWRWERDFRVRGN